MTINPVETFLKFTRSLSFKLSFYAGLMVFLALTAFAYHSIRGQEQRMVRRMVEGVLRDSEIVKAAVWTGMMSNDREVIRSTIRAITPKGGFETVTIYDHVGRQAYSGVDVGKGAGAAPVELRRIQAISGMEHSISEDGNKVSVINPILNHPGCSTAACHAHPESQKILGFLAMTVPLGPLKDEVYRTGRNTLVFAFILFIGMSTVIGLAVIFMVHPSLRRLQEYAQRIARGEYVVPAVTQGRDEIADLSRSFDEMNRRIVERTTLLVEGRKMYKSLFEEVPCYLTAVNRDYVITRANRAFTAEFGDHVGKLCYVAYKGRASPCRDCPVDATFKAGRSHQSEETWRTNGSQAHVIVKTAPLFDDAGAIAEVLEMSIDVTRLKRLQMELEKRKEEYKNLFSQVPCYVTVIGRNFDIVQANRAFSERFGPSIGRKCYEVYKGRDALCETCPVARTFEDGGSHQCEEIWGVDKDKVHVIVNTAPLTDEQGEISSVIEMSVDVTEVKNLQGELALLGETIAGMSHTVKNILSGLQGGVYMVDSGLDRDKPERVRQGWDMVKRHIEKVSDLVKGILYACKEREPEYAECDPGELLADVCDLYEETARKSGVRIVRDFHTGVATVSLDPAGMHSVVANLMSNALEAFRSCTDPRDRFIVVSAQVDSDARLRIEVRDNGVGMPGEVQEKLFGRFYSTKGTRGTGLGLVITKKVITEHGGSIHVESSPSEGTTFRLDIPAFRAQVQHGLKEAV